MPRQPSNTTHVPIGKKPAIGRGASMTWQERALLALTIVGFVVPHIMGLALIPFIIERGVDVTGFFTVFFETRRSAQLAADVIIAFLAFALWAALEGRRLGMRAWWLPILASLLVGFCF